MARWSRTVPILAATLLLAACGQGATDTPLSAPAMRGDGSGGGTTLGGNAAPTTVEGANPSIVPDAAADSTADRTGGTTLGGN